MSMRIRYSQPNQAGILVSVKTYFHPTNGAAYQVQLDLANNAWSVVDAYSGISVAKGMHHHPHKLKLAARDALEALGVEISTESRTKAPSTPEGNQQ